MLLRRSAHSQGQRQGVILLVVVSLLMLFALVGLTFVLYANSCQAAARGQLEGVTQRQPDVEPELLLSYFMGQLLYDAPDDESGVYSGLRGHSLSRNLYGMNYLFESDGRIKRNNRGELVDAAGNVLNDVPFNGTGRKHDEVRLPFTAPLPDGSPAKYDDNLVNYTYFPADGFLRDPERQGVRPGLRPAGPHAFVGGFNAPYTYPDLNNLFLAAVKADGTLLLPSFHRPWNGFGTLAPDNWRWTSDVDPNLSPSDALYGKPQPWLKYLTLRPRPADMGAGFPSPGDAGGDVKNLMGGPGGNDSIWLDLDFPVLRAPDGRKFKPLFAPLVMDLDNRVNLNVHGNLRGLNSTRHASHQGWGPWEVNPEHIAPRPKLLDADYRSAVARRQEWANLLSGTNHGDRGRYGRSQNPHSKLLRNEAPGPAGRSYAPVDFDGSRELSTGIPGAVGRPTDRIHLPGSGTTPPYLCFPKMSPLAGYGNVSARYGDSALLERTNHPLLFNPIQPDPRDHAFLLCNLEALLRHNDTGSEALTSELLRLCPRNFLDGADPKGSALRRGLVTLASFDQDRPGITPSGPVSTPPYLESEFGPDGRAAAALTALRRLDLNRYLPDYPIPDAMTGRISDADITKFTVAEVARQHFAAEIFEVLWRTTGTGTPTLTPPPGKPGHDAERWNTLRKLAQLAVNIVDYIDADDYITPFNWFTGSPTDTPEWVYGTELPRVLVNEVYVEYTNNPNDTGLQQSKPKATQFKANVWVELYNPLRDEPPSLTGPNPQYRKGEAQLELPQASGQPAIYQIVIAQLHRNADIRQPENVRGEMLPGEGTSRRVLSSFSPEPGFPSKVGIDTRIIRPDNAGGYASDVGGNKGFYVLGPSLSPTEKNPFPLVANQPMETLRRSEMSYVVDATTRELLPKPSLLLQRLACPHLPFQNEPLMLLYNPYITVDYVREIPPNYAAEVGLGGLHLPEPQPVAERASWGRRQPYAADPSQLDKQQPDRLRLGEPRHTFFQHNTPGSNWPGMPQRYLPFDWLVHLDRQLISPMELLQVSAFKPHELTQQFMTGETQKFTHRAAWLDEDPAASSTPHRLYRALEFLGTHSRILGMMTASATSPLGVPLPGQPAPPPLPPFLYPNYRVTPQAMSGTTANGGTWRIEVGSSLVIDKGGPGEEVVRVKAVGTPASPTWFQADFLKPHGPNFTIAPTTVSERVPGRINLNTVWDEETFQALCDANSSNSFNAKAVTDAFNRLKASRKPLNPTGAEAPDFGDQPLRSLTAGLQDTLLRLDPSSPGLPILAVPSNPPHPYQTFELLTKVANNVTVRSNVFAVWITVGFFEVTDETSRPVKLGAELAGSEGRGVRHRMFAIVDRSVMTANPGPQPRFDPRGPSPAVSTGRVVPYFSIID